MMNSAERTMMKSEATIVEQRFALLSNQLMGAMMRSEATIKRTALSAPL